MVLGIGAVLACWFVLGALPGVVGLILSLVGLDRARKMGAPRGMAIAGIVLNAVAIAGAVVVVVVLIATHGQAFHDLTQCLANAGGDSAARNACEQQFRNSFLSPQP